MAVRLLGMAEELDPEVQHKIAHRVRDPQGTVITETTGEFAIGAESPRADWLTGIVLPMVVQFEVAAEGTHHFELEVDDASNSLPLHIVHGLPPGVEVPE